MVFIWIYIFIFTLVTTSECSQVIDVNNQKGLHISDYCPKIGECEEGRHVLCLYYNPLRKMGPTCSDAVDISITPDVAQMILDIMNRIRKRVAGGLLKGKNDVELPRGYGIHRLSWDEELATFAQVWANQCIWSTDLCRATTKFPEPGQTVGLIRFTADGWQSLHETHFPNSSIPTTEKIKYAITTVFKAWYDMKKYVAIEDLKKIDLRIANIIGNGFFYLVHGNISHVGCGISAYKEYAYHNNNAALNYNSIQFVCNYSTRFRKGLEVFTIDPPTKPGYTVKCGCPLGYDEDEDCLCYETGRALPYSCKESNRCKPSVVVLPIFTVDNAPKKLQDLGRNNATALVNTNEIFDRYDAFDRRRIHEKNGIVLDKKQIHSDTSVRYPVDVKSRNFGMNVRSRKNHHRTEIPHHSSRTGPNRKSKQSVFSMAPIFELNIRKTNPITHKKLVDNVKKDVAPRKDFGDLQTLVSNYLETKRSTNTFDAEELNLKSYNSLHTLKKQKVIQTTLRPDQLVNNDNDIITNLSSYNYTKFANVDTSHKLTSLLDELERKIKEIDLNTNEKEMFDEKIRKMYITLVEKSAIKKKYKLNILWNNQSKADEINNYNIKADSERMLRNNYFESLKPEVYSYRGIKNKRMSTDNDPNINFSRDNRNDITNRSFDIDNNENREMRNIYDVRKKTQKIIDYDDNYLQNIKDEELIETGGRRRYYDNKLAALRRKIDSLKRNVYQHKLQDRKLRPVRPTKPADEKTYVKSKERLNTFYMPDRARFLHGF